MLAYIFLQLKECDEEELLGKLKAFEEVNDANVLFGEWDLIAQVKVADAEQLSNFMIEKVRPLDEVKLTSTMIVAK